MNAAVHRDEPDDRPLEQLRLGQRLRSGDPARATEAQATTGDGRGSRRGRARRSPRPSRGIRIAAAPSRRTRVRAGEDAAHAARPRPAIHGGDRLDDRRDRASGRVHRRRASASRIAPTTAATVVLERVAVGRDDPRVVGDAQRRDGSRSRRGRRAAGAPRGSPALRSPAGRAPRSSARRRARSSSETSRYSFEVRVRQHDGADVATGHDDATGRGRRRAGARAARRARHRPRTRPTTAASTAGPRSPVGDVDAHRRGRATGDRSHPARARPAPTSSTRPAASSTDVPRASASHVTARYRTPVSQNR